jgi:DNA-binding NtrC family response regulator
MKILVVDDEELIRWSLCAHLTSEGYEAIEATNGQEALARAGADAPAAMLLDLKMPVLDGMETLRRLRETDPDLPVIVLTAHGGIESAMEATRLGAAGYLPKPFDLREVTLVLRRALDADRVRRELAYHRTRGSSGYDAIVGKSPAMRAMFATLNRLEGVDPPTVLISGESGTGKDLVARAIHARGPRRDRPFTEVDCTALPENLIESELFGHERGAFTDARTTKRGLFEVAAGGVVFLDEIGELPLGMQAKLLRVLENRRFRRVGGVADLPFDATVITATNRNLREEVRAGRFREDLFYRLNVVPLHVPALRERPEDVPLLVQHFLERARTAFGRRVRGVSPGALEQLVTYAWPGNVRELRNVVERAVILLQGDTVEVGDLPPEVTGPPGHRRSGEPVDDGTTRAPGTSSIVTRASAEDPFVLPDHGVDLEAVEKSLVRQALARTHGNQSAAAKLLAISRYALRNRMEKFGLREG